MACQSVSYGAKASERKAGVRRLGTILAFGTLACACLLGQTRTTFPGMSRFTDAGFGFSFCYPAAWKVLDKPVADPTGNGWFPDAKIVKELQIHNPAAYQDDQPTGVMIQELLAPEGLTELGRSKSASPVGVDQKYFFDSGTRRWMFATLSESPDGTPPATSPAGISRRTIGGLPIFWGAIRGGAEVIVPLDGFHFLAISTLDYGGYNSHIYLAATVVATDPSAGQRASEQLQTQAIRREAVKLGVFGESIGYWYKDGQHVYDSTGEVILGADPQTFTPWSPTGPTGSYARDRMRVYDSNGTVIPGADPKTFVATGLYTAEDAHHTYDWSSGSLKISNVIPHK
jgi:hypothetical protein